MGPKNGLKTRKNRNFFCSKSLPEGSSMVSRPQNPLKKCNGPHRSSFWTQFVGKMGQKGPQKRVFLKEIFFIQNYFWRGLWPFLWLHKSDMTRMRSIWLHHAHEELSSIGTLVLGVLGDCYRFRVLKEPNTRTRARTRAGLA